MKLNKSRLRHRIASLAAWSGLLAAQERLRRSSLTILCYHRVLPEDKRRRYHDPDLVITPEAFKAHCRVLSRYYDVVTLSVGLQDWQAGVAHGRPRAAITFDDGYADNARYAAPILDRFGLKATFYVVSGLAGTTDQPWYDRAGRALLQIGRDACAEIAAAKNLAHDEREQWLEDLERRAPAIVAPDPDDTIMSVEALRSLAANGHEIGSHTVTHPLLPQLDRNALDREVMQSRRSLGDLLGADVLGFSYPNGDYNQNVLTAVKQAGYNYAVSAAQGINKRRTCDVYALKRWFISQERLADPDGRQSEALLRLEISGLAQHIFQRGDNR
jgi:peptidoglycan/xylan/chitin deacetylase (PgdA/CDA1 family)